MSRLSRRVLVCGIVSLVLGLLCLPLLAQTPTPAEQTQAPTKDAPPSANRPSADVASSTKLGTGDLIEISVFGVPDLTTKARIANSGDVYLPLIDYVHLADLTVDEAQELIEKRLQDGGFVRNPHVTITVNESTSQAITMMGEIARPGPYPAIGERHLFDMITAAGGLTDKAGRIVTIVHADHPDKPETVELGRNLVDKPEANVPVQPRDAIEVHRAPVVYVIGDVGRPSGLMVDSGKITVMQAIALVGGTNRTAKLSGTRIIRKSDGPMGMTQTPVPLKEMLQAKAADVPLEPNDILYVPISGGKIFAARTFEAAMAITTSLAIYSVHP